MEYLLLLKNYSWGGNTLYDYAAALLIFIGFLIILKLVKVVIIGRLQKLAKSTKNDFDDTVIAIVNNVRPPFYFLVAIFFSLQLLELPSLSQQLVKIFFIIALVYEVVRGLERIIDYFILKYLKRIEEGDEKHSKAMVKAANVLLKVVLWLVGITLLLANLGINVTSIIASLGIGGIAIALAVQNILGDMFSSFSIYLDKPFKVGDFIVIGDDMGTVERIGLKTTRIRTLQGEELVVSNNELISVRIQNFKRMQKRRVAFEIGVVYDTRPEKLEKIPNIVKTIVDSTTGTTFDRCHFKAYGDSALIYEVVFYAQTPDFNAYMDIRQKINLDVFRAFGQEKIEFAYPTRTVYVRK